MNSNLQSYNRTNHPTFYEKIMEVLQHFHRFFCKAIQDKAPFSAIKIYIQAPINTLLIGWKLPDIIFLKSSDVN